ncbi:unnamed protein product [Dracunculus medinensis]|uniref:Complex1_LYR_dom domain-containing protein n=1 Tax=Dracunculus medinensis TaxID=318479 RepID=A0A0N4UQ31_DRAME|nr:unnamed protein product [Dracunculus medinensis]
MAVIARSAWISLYKDLQRSAAKFPQYNYRRFFRRRIRDHFERALADKNLSEIEFQQKCQDFLAIINRQVAVHSYYPPSKLIIEQELDQKQLNS